MRIESTVVMSACLLMFTAFVGDQSKDSKSLVPSDPVAVIVNALRSHDVVGLSAGEGHGDLRGEAFVVALIHDPRFGDVPVDVVVEAGNARFQDVMDRYVRGEHVDAAALRPVWDDSTQAQLVSAAGEIPETYRAIREVNAARPSARRIRAVLPDPPIEWERVATNVDYLKWLEQRDSYGADAIRREVLAKGRRALLVFGGGHLQRRNQLSNYQMEHPLAQTVISLLEQGGVKTFVVRTAGQSLQGSMDTWPVPSVALLRGTALGRAPEPSSDQQRLTIEGGRLVPVPRERWASMPLEDQVDALLFLGPTSGKRTKAPPVSICSEPGYVEARLKRMTLAGLPPPELDRLKKLCAK